MWHRTALWLACAGGLVPGLAAGKPAIDDLVGIYKVPAARCSEMAPGGRLVSCSSQVSDCLELRKVSPSRVQVRFSSAQTNGHQCGGEGEADVVPEGFLLCPADEDYRGQCTLIGVTANALVLHLRGKRTYRDFFCGQRATVEGLRFSRRARRAQGTCRVE